MAIGWRVRDDLRDSYLILFEKLMMLDMWKEILIIHMRVCRLDLGTIEISVL